MHEAGAFQGKKAQRPTPNKCQEWVCSIL